MYSQREAALRFALCFLFLALSSFTSSAHKVVMAGNTVVMVNATQLKRVQGGQVTDLFFFGFCLPQAACSVSCSRCFWPLFVLNNTA